MPVAGVDVGSVAAKAVIFDPQSRSLLGKAVLPTGWNAREAGEKALAAACADAGGIAASRIVGTGYGRISLPFADKVVTEITCHARGAVHLFPGTGVVLDIGGQDSKVISTAPDGSVQDFLMNDKCAAGTGRFLQVLSGILGMELAELGKARRHFQHVRRIRGDGNHRPACAGYATRRYRRRRLPLHRPAYAGPCRPHTLARRMHVHGRAGDKPFVQQAAFRRTRRPGQRARVSATRRSHRSGLDCRPHLNGFTTIP